MEKSSMNTSMLSSMSSWKMAVIQRWKVVGALHNPNGIRIRTLEKEVAEIKKDPLHTQVTSLVDEHLDIRLGETKEEFMNFLSESFTTRIKEQVKDQLPQILPKEVSNFAPPNIRVISFTMKMEILLEPTSNKLMVEHAEFDESDTYVLERFDTSAGNPVKEILLKLNLPDHKSILTDSKMEVKVPDSS
ncbi:hypothetical protein Tco_0703601 [Tanacetum coccineum]|uniref:Uncharacterized protein n=1 Tax=Tanacetum coccineum TaxID=301880 RepID=A0ABQ4Y092_9ASTR